MYQRFEKAILRPLSKLQNIVCLGITVIALQGCVPCDLSQCSSCSNNCGSLQACKGCCQISCGATGGDACKDTCEQAGLARSQAFDFEPVQHPFGDPDWEPPYDRISQATFNLCFTGTEGGASASWCSEFDYDQDDDVDLRDFKQFQETYQPGDHLPFCTLDSHGQDVVEMVENKPLFADVLASGFVTREELECFVMWLNQEFPDNQLLGQLLTLPAGSWNSFQNMWGDLMVVWQQYNYAGTDIITTACGNLTEQALVEGTTPPSHGGCVNYVLYQYYLQYLETGLGL